MRSDIPIERTRVKTFQNMERSVRLTLRGALVSADRWRGWKSVTTGHRAESTARGTGHRKGEQAQISVSASRP